MLAMAIGTRMGLEQWQLIELGMGCWIHDVGMACVDPRLVEADRLLAAGEFAEIAKHPLRTFDIIEKNIDAIPVAARMVAYQIHERADGSGYPRGRTLAQTHPLARIAAVADTYAALVAPRPHRPGMQPYYAIEKVLADTKRGLFDPKAVRGLLETVGLFPIGSFVEFSNSDYIGRVIRSNGAQFALPIVEIHRRTAPETAPSIVDLAQDTTLKISRPIAP
jgi:HD-GYP domain-containing protein (c-di-GMP phosphodiesterase class II)